MERYLELPEALLPARSCLCGHICSQLLLALILPINGKRAGELAVEVVTQHNGLNQGPGSSLFVWYQFLRTDRQPFLLKSLLGPQHTLTVRALSWQEARLDLCPYYPLP